jgi:hypothetical protein
MEPKSAIVFKQAGAFFRNPQNGIVAAIGIVLVLLTIKCVSVALTGAFHFDGAMNVQVAQNLVKDFKYKTNYDGKLFDTKVQTGIPLTLPVAMLFSLFGESFANGLMVNAIYLILLTFALVWYLKKNLKFNNALVLLAIILLCGTPNLIINGFGLLGEIPMFFYFMVAMIFLGKHEDTAKSKYLFWAGLFVGLSYLTKTVILICIPALIFAAIFDFMIKRRLTLKMRADVKKYFREYAMLPTGFLVPVFIFELYKLILLGIGAYLRWWKDQLVSILHFAGVKSAFADTKGIFAKFTTHLDLLSSFLGINRVFIVIVLGVLLLSFFAIFLYGLSHFWKRRQPEKREKILFSNHVLVMITVTLSYYGWWLLITPTWVAWDRHIFVGYILLEICSVMIISFLINFCERPISHARKTPRLLYKSFTVVYIFLLIAGAGYNLIHSRNFAVSFKDSAEKKTLLEAGQYIRSLPQNAEIMGYGWFQAPVVAFASGRTFDNIFNNKETRSAGPLNEKYLVMDSSAYYLDGGAHKNVLSQYDNKLVFSKNDNYIYKLNSRRLFAYEEFSDLEKAKVSYSKIDFSRDTSCFYARNVYIGGNSHSGKCAQDISGCLLKYQQEGILKINLLIFKLKRYDQTPIELRIYANRALACRYTVNQDGPQEIIVPLKNISGETLEITIESNSAIKLEGDSRQMSLVLNGMELLK